MAAHNVPNAKHPYHAFLSYSHVDRPLVDQIHKWLEGAGLRIYQDVVEGEVSAYLHTRLAERIQESWSLLIFFSEHSVNSSWVEEEWNYGLTRQKELKGFRVVPVRIGKVDLPAFLRSRKCIEIPDGNFSLRSAVEILDGLSGSNDGARSAIGRDVYVARSWREGKPEFDYAEGVCRRLHAEGFRLIGDAKGHFDGYDRPRLRRLIESCAGFVAILPHRGQGMTSTEMIDEVKFARALGLSPLLIADDEVAEPPEWPDHTWHKASTLDPSVPEDEDQVLGPAIEVFRGEFLERTERPCLYLAPKDYFEAQFGDQHPAVPRLRERVTRLPCVLEQTTLSKPFQQNAFLRLRSAVCVLADISTERDAGFVNIGAAIGAKRPLHVSLRTQKLAAESPTGLLGIPDISEYSTPEELLRIVYYAATRYRRQIYNDTFTID